LGGITGNLHNSSAIAEIDKDNAPMISTTIDPTKESNRLTNMA
jgi:hypothetical protein